MKYVIINVVYEYDEISNYTKNPQTCNVLMQNGTRKNLNNISTNFIVHHQNLLPQASQNKLEWQTMLFLSNIIKKKECCEIGNCN